MKSLSDKLSGIFCWASFVGHLFIDFLCLASGFWLLPSCFWQLFSVNIFLTTCTAPKLGHCQLHIGGDVFSSSGRVVESMGLGGLQSVDQEGGGGNAGEGSERGGGGGGGGGGGRQ
jgi:hypothetical protein